MPRRYRKRTFRRRPKRTFRRRFFRKKGSSYKINKVYSFKRKYIPNSFNSSTVGTNFDAWKFQLSDLPNYTEFTSLFDQYKITGVKLRFTPRQNDSVPTTNCGMLYHAIDLDDNSVPTQITDLTQYQNCRSVCGYRPFNVWIRPRFAVASYSGAFTSYANFAGWIDAGSSTVQHYGWKYAWTGTSAVMTYDCVATYYIKVRNVH